MSKFDVNGFAEKHSPENKQIIEYFGTCMDVINEDNLFMLRKLCMYISCVYIFVLIGANYLLPKFAFGRGHFLMFPLLITYYFVNSYTRKNHTKIPTGMVAVICTTFYFCLAVIFIMLDTKPGVDASVFWLPMLMMIFPLFFIDRMYKYGIEELLVIILFLLQATVMKSRSAFLRDFFLVGVAYVLSMLEAHMILEMRSKESLAAKELTKISSLDKLTHVLNKGALVSRIESHYMLAPEGESTALCIIDLDDFKKVNDNLGHITGDILLERVGQLLLENFRAYDIIGRYGGDEFVVMMPKMDDISILQMRCRTVQMFLTDFSIDGGNQSCSVSIGAVISSGIRNYESAFRMADDALYRSKLNGKNCCTSWVVNEKEYDKPIIIAVHKEMDDGVARLYRNAGPSFEVISADNDNSAICLISQYLLQLKLVVIDVDDTLEFGETVIKYLKTREAFADIPMLVMATNENTHSEVKEMGVDEVIMKDAPEDEFTEAISRCLRLE